jgi:hypothetical protein
MIEQNKPELLFELIQKHRRLGILRVLNQTPSHKSNDLVLYDWLFQIGLGCNRDDLTNEFNLLEREGLITTAPVKDVLVLDLTNKGKEVAKGISVNSSVAKPEPDCPY